MTNQEAKQHLARKLGVDYTEVSAGTNDLWSETDFQTFIQLGLIRAWDYRPWPFTRKVKKATTISTDYYDYPTDVMLGSIYRLTVGGEEYKKLIDEDYFKYLEDNPTATDKIWTEIETYVFVNKNAYTVGDEMDQFGKKLPPTLSGTSDLLPFSPATDNYEHSGNEAIVILAFAEALDSDRKKDAAGAERQTKKGYGLLDILWKPFADSRALLQSKGRPMFDVPDFFSGSAQSSSSIGNFDYLN